MRLYLNGAKGQRLLTVNRVHAGINWQLWRLCAGGSLGLELELEQEQHGKIWWSRFGTGRD